MVFQQVFSLTNLKKNFFEIDDLKRLSYTNLNNFTNDSRVLKECISLQGAGYHVQVIALHENNLLEKEHVQGLPVHRVKLKTRNWSKCKPIQLVKYFELTLRVVKKFRNKVDVVHCHDLNTLPLGFLIKKFSIS